jgi:2,4-dienoyl-CoA reductase-like NADH-dependent reductase (Old Yellow Enzyme family)/thioredoxin reductase
MAITMEPKYKHLLEPITIRGNVIKNRMVAANSLPHFLQGPEPFPADSVIAHLANKAKGAGIVTCMGINNFTRGKQFPMNLDFSHFPDFDLYDTTSQNYLLQLADAIHFYGTLASMSIFIGPPSGYPLMVKKHAPPRDGEKGREDGDPFSSAPSLDEFTIELINPLKKPEDYSEEELEKIARSYAEQAVILKTLDFDIVSLHFAYRANPPAKFLSPLKNFRTDQWGGSLENRMRFPLLVLRKVREALGPGKLLEIVYSAEDPPGGYTLDDSVVFLNSASEYIDIVQLRAGEVDPAHPTGFTLEETPFLHYAEYIKRRVQGVAVATIGGYQDPDLAEAAVAEGKADLIAMSRAWLSNTEYGRLVEEGRKEDIVPCLRCNKCHGRGRNDPFQSICSVNPVIGLEHNIDRLTLPVTRKKKVVVAGGGPAGMLCAVYLADRGHEVSLYEAKDGLGGLINHADYMDFKWPLRRYRDYLVHQIEKRRDHIKVLLNSPASPDLLRQEGFDTVITALGAVPVRPAFPGLEKHPAVFTAYEAITGTAALPSARPEKKAVIIGGGEVGVETGIYLARRGYEVMVLEMRNMLAADSVMIHYYSMFKQAWEAEPNFHALVNATVCGLSDRAVSYRDKEGRIVEIVADLVVFSAGMKAKTEEALSFYGTAPEFYMIGDCKAAATVQQAVRSAYSTAMRI